LVFKGIYVTKTGDYQNHTIRPQACILVWKTISSAGIWTMMPWSGLIKHF